MFHCAGGKDRTGLIALVLLALGGATADEIAADYLLTYERMAATYARLGYPDVLGRMTAVVERHGTTVDAALAASIAALPMPDYLLDNGLTEPELSALETRLTSGG